MTPRLSVFVFYLFFCLNHCAQARPHTPQYDYRRVWEARSLCAPTPPAPTKREEPRDELSSSSAWPQTAPLTPRPVGRMGAVRACLKRRHSSAPVHARRAEGRALVCRARPRRGAGGARGAAEVARTCFLLNSTTKLTNNNTPQLPPAREASEASLPPLRARKGSMRACHRGCKACGQQASPRGDREEGCTATARMDG